MGLLNEIVPRSHLLDRAREWAARITENAPLAVAATKESALRGLGAESFDEALRIEARISARILQTDDAREGPRAFTEKRAPRWTAS
jgi:enoyl-CoA hydratase